MDLEFVGCKKQCATGTGLYCIHSAWRFHSVFFYLHSGLFVILIVRYKYHHRRIISIQKCSNSVNAHMSGRYFMGGHNMLGLIDEFGKEQVESSLVYTYGARLRIRQLLKLDRMKNFSILVFDQIPTSSSFILCHVNFCLLC